MWWNAATVGATPSVGFFRVQDGNVTLENQDARPQHELTINGSGGLGDPSDFSISGAATSVTNRGLHLRSLGGGQLTGGATLTLDGSHSAGAQLTVEGNLFKVDGSLNVESGATFNGNTNFVIVGASSGSTGTATVTGTGSRWNSDSLVVGSQGSGTLNVADGGVVSSDWTIISEGRSSTAYAAVTGTGSQWNSGSLSVGAAGDGTLNVAAGGVVSSGNSIVGQFRGSTSYAAVTGAGSRWNSDILVVGFSGNGTLDIVDGGVVSSTNGQLAPDVTAESTVSVSGAGSRWNLSADLLVGGTGQGRLNIVDNGLVTVDGTTLLGADGTINLDNGRLDSAGALTNSGKILGDGLLGATLANQPDGEVQTSAGQTLHVLGAGNTNAGEINNFGGAVRFDQDVTNQAVGFVGGRGQFIADGGWTNEGVMAFSAAPADVLGDLNNTAGGQIVTSGFAVTTFFDDVVHNGAEIRTSAGSGTVILGAASGAGPYTGTGTVFFEGDLRPGNSPGMIDFAGDVSFGTFLNTEIELSGINLGEFDRLQILGDLSLDGELLVDLIDGFELSLNQEFIIADVGGALSGQFDGLGEGALVGNFGGQDLFITYAAGTGNDVALFTPVPEPGTFVLLAVGIAALAAWRKKRTV